MHSRKLIALTALVLGSLWSVSIAQAGSDSGEYKGGALFGPEPGQIFAYPRANFGYFPRGAYAYYPRGARGAYAFVPRRGSPTNPPNLRAEFPTAPWDEY